MKKELIPAGGYIRMSTDQQADSPERQRSEVERLAEREGYEIVEWYEDHGMTGTESAKRGDFQRLLVDAKAGKFKAVLTYEQSRLSREDVFDVMQHWRKLRDAGVTIITCQSGKIDFANLGGLITAIVNQYSSNDEVRKFSMRSTSGRRAKLDKGERIGGCPFAYDRELLDESGRVMKRVDHREKFTKPKTWKTRLVISLDLAAVEAVRWMYQAVADGVTLAAIVREMERRRVLTRNGKKLARMAIKQIIRNPVYKGTLRAGSRSRPVKFSTVTDRLILVDDVMPAIVDKLTWERAQQALQHASRCRPKTPGKYLLTGLLHCGHCDRQMYGSSNATQRRYLCTRSKNGSEPHMFATADAIEDKILTIVYELLLKPNEDAIRLGLCAAQEDDGTAALEQSLVSVRDKLTRAGEMLALAGSAESLRRIETQVADWEREDRDILAKIEGLRNRCQTKASAEASIQELRAAHGEVIRGERARVMAVLRLIIGSVVLKARDVGNKPFKYRLTLAQLHFKPEIWSGAPLTFVVSGRERGAGWLAYIRALAVAGRPLNIQELAALTESTRRNATHQLYRLRRAGFVTTDSGVSILTSSGKEVYEATGTEGAWHTHGIRSVQHLMPLGNGIRCCRKETKPHENPENIAISDKMPNKRITRRAGANCTHANTPANAS